MLTTLSPDSSLAGCFSFPGYKRNLQAAAPAQRIVAAVRAAVGPLVSMAPPVTRLFERLQRLYFLSEGQDISA